MIRSEYLDTGPDLPTLAIVAGRTPEDTLRIALLQEKRSPDVALLVVTDVARKLRGQRGALPPNVSWAVSPDELSDVRFLALVMRYAIEVAGRRRLERRLQGVLPMAEMGSVASATAHEIGNPLTSLLTNLELARTQIANAISAREGVDLSALLGTVTDALDGSRHLARVASDLGRASGRAGRLVTIDVRQVLDTARRLALEPLRGVEVRTTGRMSALGRVDETRLCQVFLNLLKNSGRALRSRTSGAIDLMVEQQLDEVVIRITDNGPGIPEGVARRLFEPWFTTTAEGTGLGLALCRQYLAEMGGTIELARTSPEGTTFEIRVPGGEPATARPTLVPDSEKRAIRILVLDDAVLIRRAIERALTPTHVVHSADTPAEALMRLNEQQYDVIFVDLHLGTSSGIAFYEELLDRLPDRAARVVFLSGAFGEADLAYLERRNLPWVRKPFGAEELRDTVAELLGTR